MGGGDGPGGVRFFFFFNDTATTEIYTLSLHDALPIWLKPQSFERGVTDQWPGTGFGQAAACQMAAHGVAPHGPRIESQIQIRRFYRILAASSFITCALCHACCASGP